jgi:hypothetical protein
MKEKIMEILNSYAGQIDRGTTAEAIHEDNFNDVSDAIMSAMCEANVQPLLYEVTELIIDAAPDMLNELINFCDYNCTDCSGKTEGCSETCGLKNAKEIIERATGMKIQEVLDTAKQDAERNPQSCQ